MFAMKWVAENGAETVYAGREISFTPAEQSRTNLATVQFFDDKGTETFIDNGTVFVMNDFGKTISSWNLAYINAGRGAQQQIDRRKKAFVDSFLAWKLPESVCSDTCVSDPNYQHKNLRSGTNLLTAVEAGQLFDDVVRPVLASKFAA